MINRMKWYLSHYNLMLIICAFSCLLSSCGTQKKGTVEIEKSRDSSIPVKIRIVDVREDSTWIRLLIPTEFDLKNSTNSRIKLSDGYLTLRGGNVNIASVLLSKRNKLELGFGDIKFDKNDQRHFKAYTSYKVMLSNEEKKGILKDAKFSQHMLKSKKEVYDIGTLENASPALLKKVPDSLKGYIRMHFYNFTTQQRFAKNIPVEF